MKWLSYLFISALVLTQVSCTKDFEKINTDRTRATPDNFDATFFLTNAQNSYKGAITGYAGPILFQSGWVQLLASTTTGGAIYYSNMDKYVQSANTMSYTANSWNSCYRAASLANEIINIYGKDAERVNAVAAATVVKVMAVAYLTDIYGDVPYSEAFQGATGLSQPKYDKQEVAMKAMLADLEKAAGMFNAGKLAISADMFYKGDVAKWKRLANSLMLRIAMRMVKRDAATAKAWAEKAAAGGVFTSDADDAVMPGDQANGYTNSNAGALRTPADLYEVRWAKTLIDYMQATSDPRLAAIAEVPAGGFTANNSFDAGDNTPANQLGLPNGYDMNGGATDISKAPGFPGATDGAGGATKIGKYSRPRDFYRNLNAPVFLITYGETQLLLAEAKVRGWNVGSASAADLYANGVRGAFASLAKYGATVGSSASDAAAYLAANPLNVSSTAASLTHINTQYWASNGMLMNFAESWNNWRRTGIPALTPVVAAGNFSNGQIPRRQMYPTSEASLNGAAYSASLSGLTPATDGWSSRVWWDN